MTTSTGELKQWMSTLNMTEAAHILEESLLDAQSKDWSCSHFLRHLLKTQEIARTSQTRMKRILGSDLVIIDDLMFMAMEKGESHLFFQFVNKLYGQTSIILTSNKGPEDWGELLGDPAITTAILDRILHKSEVIKLSGDSFRLKHRETIFGNA